MMLVARDDTATHIQVSVAVNFKEESANIDIDDCEGDRGVVIPGQNCDRDGRAVILEQQYIEITTEQKPLIQVRICTVMIGSLNLHINADFKNFVFQCVQCRVQGGHLFLFSFLDHFLSKFKFG